MLNLNLEKQLAIDNEDYDMAKQIKQQIEQVKEVAYQIGQPPPQQQQELQPSEMGNYDDMGNGIEGQSVNMQEMDQDQVLGDGQSVQ